MILSGDGIDVLLAQALAAPSGNDDQSWHMGKILTWDDLSGVNTVQVNGTVIPNMKSIVGGVGASYRAGDNVMIQRKQTQYVIHGKLQAPGISSGSTPTYADAAGGLISGATGTWRDLDAGTGVSPSVTLRLGTNQGIMIAWGAGNVSMVNSGIEIGWQVSGDANISAGSFQGMSCSGNATSGGAVPSTGITIPMMKEQVFKSGFGGAGQRLYPGVSTFVLKYRMNLSGTGINVTVGTPWIRVTPF
jgi:hypothetical protein